MLPHRAQFAIKALLHLARHRDECPVQATSISEVEQIPCTFLEGSLLHKRMRGFITSTVGGHELAKIDLLTVVRAIDGLVALLPCVSHTASR